MAGRTIRIFLVDGTAFGLRTAEVGMSTIKAVVIPRASFSLAAKRPELFKTGVYILIGTDADVPGQKKIYIGEGDMILNRLSIHNRDPEKDFWEEAIILVSKDENLTKAHARFLEARLIEMARNAKRSTVTNGTAPSEQGRLPEADAAEMEEFISQAQLLLGALGYDIFSTILPSVKSMARESHSEQESLLELTYEGEGFSATCFVDLDAGQFIVQKGSKARMQEAAALIPTYRNLRKRLRDNGVLVDFSDGSYMFSQDYSFNAPTPAAQVVSGTSINGRMAWRTKKEGKTFAAWQEEQLQSEPGSEP